MKYRIKNKEFRVKIAKRDATRKIGLSQTASLPKNSGMILEYSSPVKYTIEMKNMRYPLDIIFILNDKVTGIFHGKAKGEDITPLGEFDKVLEINLGESKDIRLGDGGEYIGEKLSNGKIDYIKPDEEKGDVAILDDKGTPQGFVNGNERIYSRKNTEKLVSLAKIANDSGLDNDYKALGKAMVNFIHKQDSAEIQTTND